jgi:anaerobic ribonucleoside-triphosphate reductase
MISVTKRDGSTVTFNESKIIGAVSKAFDAKKQILDDEVRYGLISHLKEKYALLDNVSIETIQDDVVRWLQEHRYFDVAIAFTTYRERRTIARGSNVDPISLVDDYLEVKDDMAVHENSSTMYSLQGLNNHLFSSISEKYWLSLYSDEIKNAYDSGRLHIHDLNNISSYCCGWDLKALLEEGFGGVPGKPYSSAPKHFSSALNQANNFIFTLQGEAAGAMAFSNFNTLLAPFVKYDNLSYKEVKQEIQEFVFNLNISTRVGFQCLSEDTEILTKSGWCRYDEVNEGDIIATFNIESKNIEYKEVINMFREQYIGEMVNFISENIDQLVTPNHKVVVAVNDGFELVDAEEICGQMSKNVDLPYYKNDLVNIELTKIYNINYSGIVWCPTTVNGTVVARRNEKCFITGNSPFSNITLDTDVVETNLKDEYVCVGGEYTEDKYSDFQKEADWISLAFVEVMEAGDKLGAMLAYPIITFNVTKNFPWRNKLGQAILKMTASHGSAYFANYINTEYTSSDITSMCCRLRISHEEIDSHLSGLDNSEYDKSHQKGHGFFGASPNTGSVGVVTLGLPSIMSDVRNKINSCDIPTIFDAFLTDVKYYMDLSLESLLKKRKVVEHYADKGLYPYIKHYLREVKKRTGQYFAQHFNTICINGFHEAAIIMGLENGIVHPEGVDYAEKLLKFMKDYSIELQKKHRALINIEQAPAESAGVKLCKKSGVDPLGNGYYTNSTWLPADSDIDMFEQIKIQARLNQYYTGGSSYHCYTDADLEPIANDLEKIIMWTFENTTMPYMTISPVFSVCEKCGRIAGKHYVCPKCNSKKIEVYERIVGYYRSHTNWNKGRKKESSKRKYLNFK